jgi:serpin B
MAGDLTAPATNSTADTTAVSLPKVSLAITGDTGNMNSVLKQLGMGLAFSQSADFLALSPRAKSIAFVQQAATLQVGEKGTIGAAAAAVGISASAGRVPSPTVTFNRPYLMLVTDTATGEPLFLAKVANPAA